MKTKEIEVWYKLPNEETRDFACYDHYPQGRPDASRFKKSKLLIELPDRKVEISESQFDEAARELARLILRSFGKRHDDFSISIRESIEKVKKQKLFGDEG